ncbi:unnamed protein product [Bathycoccus prasinos]
MESLPQTAPTITIRELIERICQTSHREFELVLDALSRNDGKSIAPIEKKRALVHHLNALKQRLVRAHALIAWAPKNAKATLVAENACNALDEHVEQFRTAADALHGMHQRLLWARAPMFDVSASFDVLCRGGFDCLDRVEGIRKVATMQKWKEEREKEIMMKKTKKGENTTGDGGAEEKEEEKKKEEEDKEEEIDLARRKTLDAKHALIVEKHALKRFPSMEGDEDGKMKFTIFDVVSGEVRCGVENMYEMTLVLDDTPTEKEVLWTCTGVEILCGEESMMVSDDDGKRKRISYQATKEEIQSLTFNATMRAKGDGTEQHPARGILGAHEAMMDAVTRLVCAKTLAQAGMLRDLAEAKSDKSDESGSNSAIEWTKRGKVVAEIVKHKGDVTGCAITLWNARKRLDVKFEVDKRKITASVVSVQKEKEKENKKDESAEKATLPSAALKTFEDTREPIDVDNGTISLLNALDLASKTATVSTLTSIRDFLVNSKQKETSTPKKSPQKKKKARPAASKKRKATAIEEEEEEEEDGGGEEREKDFFNSLGGVTFSEVDDATLTFSIVFDRDEVDKNSKELASVSAVVSVNKYKGIVQCEFQAYPDSIIDRDDVDDIICYGSFKHELAKRLESASESNDPQNVGLVFLELIPEMREIAKMFIVRKYLEPSLSALFAPYSIENLKEILKTTRRVAGANVAAVIKADDYEHLLEKDGTFVCVWEDGATMSVKCAKRRSTLERWRVDSCSEITRNGETLGGGGGGGGVKRAKTTKGKTKTTPSSSEGLFEGAATISIESLSKIAADAVKRALK